MVTFPLLSGLLLGGWSVAGLAFAALVVTAFLAYESVAVLTGGRGTRVKTSRGDRARGSLVPLGLVAVAAAAVFLAWAPAHVRILAGAPVVLGAAVLGLSLAGRVKSLPGELLVAGAFASAHLPVAGAGGAAGDALWGPPVVWVAGFGLATLTVHSLKHRFKGRGRASWTVPVTPLAAALLLLLGVAGPLADTDLRALGALVPVTVVPLGLSLLPVHPRNLKRVGWTLVGVDALALLLLLILTGP